MSSVLIACDGTGCKDAPGDARDSNVAKLAREYRGSVVYKSGPGTGDGFAPARWFNLLTGLDAGRIAKAAARDALRERARLLAHARTVHAVRVHGVGFSRGCPILLRVCELMDDYGVTIDSVMLIDPVYSIGVPVGFRWMDRRWPQEIPSNVASWDALYMEHVKKIGFAPTVFHADERGQPVRTQGSHTEGGSGSRSLWWLQWVASRRGWPVDLPCGEMPDSNGWPVEPYRDLPEMERWP
jgi:hypothetical protein